MSWFTVLRLLLYRSVLELFSKSFKVFHCSVINVRCCYFQQLVYFIISSSRCQQLFYFFFVVVLSRQLWYLIMTAFVCQQLFWFFQIFFPTEKPSFLRWIFILPYCFLLCQQLFTFIFQSIYNGIKCVKKEISIS